MIHWFLSVKGLIRSMDQKARSASTLYEHAGKEASEETNKFIKTDYQQLYNLWLQKFPDENLGNLGRHITWGEGCDFLDLINQDLPALEERAEQHLRNSVGEKQEIKLGFEELLHPTIKKNAYSLYCDGHLRDAVLNSIIAVYDLIRQRTGLEEDGDKLIGEALSLSDPLLILSELDSSSGMNDQKGFMQIFKGAYQGIRNPKAHSLMHNLTNNKAAQYLVFSSLLARRIEEAEVKCTDD